jgi:putative ABC transport system permease protein
MGAHFVETLVSDGRYAIRMLRKAPGYAAVAVITLALGIGATTTVFCLTQAVFWQPLPYRDAKHLIFLTEGMKSIGDLSISYPDFLSWQKQLQAFDGIAAYQETSFVFDSHGQPERISGRNVSANFLEVLDAIPALGRGFVAADNQQGAPPVFLSSYAFWQTHLGANPAAIGATIRLDGRPFTLVGVLPRKFVFETPADVYAPIGRLANTFPMQNRAKHPFIHAIARLKRGATLAAAQTELQAISRRLQQQYPSSNAGVYALATPLQEELAQGTQTIFRALAIAVGLLLVISCVNVANLLLARASQRESEFAVRAALGAKRSRIVRQVLTESILLGLCGAACGLVLASACLSGLRVLIPAELDTMIALRINTVTVVFALVTCVLTAMAFGLFPFLFTSHANLNEPLKNATRTGGAEFARRRLRSLLVISEIALAFVVLTSAGLVFRSFRLASQVDPGFELSNVLTMRITVSHSNYSADRQLTTFFQNALTRLRHTPGVASAAAVFPLPFTSKGYPFGFSIEGQPIPAPGQMAASNFHFVTPGYFDVMEIPLLGGRDFSTDDDEKSPPVAIISQNFAARYWPRSDAIGKRIQLDPAEGGRLVTVIGVVGNTKESGLDAPATTELYLPYAQQPIPFTTFVLRTAVPPLALTGAAVNAIHAIDSVDPLYDSRTLSEYAADALLKRKTNAFLFCAIALLIIALSAIGVYAMISYDVARRTREIGVRMALGAQRGAILRLVFQVGVAFVILGIAAGSVAALILDRAIASLLFGIGDNDPLTFAGVAILLMLISLAACYLPARRAMHVDPIVALRYE